MAMLCRANILHNPRERRQPTRSSHLKALALLASVFAPMSVWAGPDKRVVDLELILAVDVSSSMSEAEQGVQRNGSMLARFGTVTSRSR